MSYPKSNRRLLAIGWQTGMNQMRMILSIIGFTSPNTHTTHSYTHKMHNTRTHKNANAMVFVEARHRATIWLRSIDCAKLYRQNRNVSVYNDDLSIIYFYFKFLFGNAIPPAWKQIFMAEIFILALCRTHLPWISRLIRERQWASSKYKWYI